MADPIPTLTRLEATLEVVERNRYSLSGRSPYAKRARSEIAELKRELDGASRTLNSSGHQERAEKLTTQLSIVTDPRVPAPAKLQALDSIRFLWEPEISGVLSNTAGVSHSGQGRAETYLPTGAFQHCPRPIQTIVNEINHSYGSGCTNGVSMLLRRLAEMLIIYGYELTNRGHEVRNRKGYVGFSELMDKALSGQVFALGSSAKQGLKDIKYFGDGASHSRFFLVNADDLAKVRPAVRVCLDELAGRCDELRVQQQAAKPS